MVGTDTRPPDPFLRTRSRHTLAVVGLMTLLVLATVWAFSEDTAPVRLADGVRVNPRDAYNPVTAGEPLPDGFRQLLPRDAIMPVYDPTFVVAAESGWPADAEVIGVAEGGEAKAYPVSFLNGRELVDDVIDDVPIVVTW